jgi:hypothetical protein
MAAVLLAGCNSFNVKPGTLDKSKTFYADRGGYSMARRIKERMEQRGYNIVVGKATNVKTIDSEDIELNSYDIMNANYVVKVRERKDVFNPLLCLFNGFWWWDFNVSIANQKTGEELLAWRGYGCANSSLRKLDRLLDEMEIGKGQ